jgi:hypothetical protein
MHAAEYHYVHLNSQPNKPQSILIGVPTEVTRPLLFSGGAVRARLALPWVMTSLSNPRQ